MDAYFPLSVRVNHRTASSSTESLLKNLSCVLGLTTLSFHEERDGLYEFKYPYKCGPEIFPLSYKQERELLEIGVQSFNCETYEFHLAFERNQDPLSASDHDLTTDSSLDSLWDYSSLFIRVYFPITSMETFEHDLSSIVHLSLNFCAEEDDCYEFKFKCPREHEVFPLSHEQEKKLLSIGVQLLKCGTYQFLLPEQESTNQDVLTAICLQSHEDTSSPEAELPISDDVNMSEYL